MNTDDLEKAKKKCPPQWANDLESIVLSEDKIQERVMQLADEISKEYAGKSIVCIGLLSGAVCFLTDLIKHLKVPYEVDFIAVSSYGNKTENSNKDPLMLKDVAVDLRNKHVLLVEDLIDTGRTLAWVKHHMLEKQCASVKVVCMLSKVARRVKKDIVVDFVGFDSPDAFIVGYGMDFAGAYRGLPFVAILKPEAYESPQLSTSTEQNENTNNNI